MANRFLSNIRINDAYTLPASDGTTGQVIVTDGAGNLSFGDQSGGASSAAAIERDNFTGDGSTTVFYLQKSLSDEDQSQVYIDGVYQEKDTYDVTGNVLTFTTAPALGDSVEVISIYGINIGPTVMYQDNFTGDGSTVNFTLAQLVENEIKTFVFLNGVYQFKGTYAINNTTLTFDAPPGNGTAIEVITIGSAAAEDYNQTMLFYGKASEAFSKGDAIMFAGQEGDHFLFAKATQAAIAANHEYFIGLASQDLSIGEFGYVTEFGRIDQIDTTVWTAGDILWFDAGGSTAGALTITEPAAPLAKIQVAAVIREHQNEGVLFVRPTWYHELGELHDVNITSIADKDMLVWDNANGYWENSKTLGDITATSLNVSGNLTVDTNTLYVDATNNRVSINGVGGDTFNIFSAGYPLVSFIDGSTTRGRLGYVFDWGHFALQSEADLVFRTGTSSGTEKVRITSAGNVGIGTSGPAAKLTVLSSTSGDGIYLPNTNNAYPTPSTGYTDIRATFYDYLTGQQNGGESIIRLGSENAYSTSRNSYISFQTSSGGTGTSSERMRITSGGNILINTTSTAGARKLVISGGSDGAIYTRGTAGSANVIHEGGHIEFYNQAAVTRAASIGLSGPASGATNDMVFNTYNGSWYERMRITDGSGIIFNSLLYFSANNNNTLNSGFNNPADDNDMWINYRGYNDGFSYYRDFRVGNGRGAQIIFVDGSASSVYVSGTFGASGSKNFKIDHPLESKKDTHYLVHAAIESPQVNNLYRGNVSLVNGYAEVNIDEACKMTEGTFTALNTNPDIVVSNKTGWDPVKAEIQNNIIKIYCKNNESIDTITWMVIAERIDEAIFNAENTDETGKLIVEPIKTEEDIKNMNPTMD